MISLDSELELVEEFREYLKIQTHQLDLCIAQQPELFSLVAEKATEFNGLKESVKHNVELLEARLSYQYRRDAPGRTTDKSTKEWVETQQSYINKRKEYIQVKYLAECWDALRNAFQQRGYMLRDLAQLYVAGFFSDISIKESIATNEVQYEESKKRLAAKRKDFLKEISSARPTVTKKTQGI